MEQTARWIDTSVTQNKHAPV